MALAAADMLETLIHSRDTAPERRLFGAQLIDGATARLQALCDDDTLAA